MSSADYVYTANMRYVRYTSVIITYSNRSTTLSSRLDLSGFCPGTETKREVWLLRTGSGIAPVNKLVSLTWLLWALRSFRSFTLHYITLHYITVTMLPLPRSPLADIYAFPSRHRLL